MFELHNYIKNGDIIRLFPHSMEEVLNFSLNWQRCEMKNGEIKNEDLQSNRNEIDHY